MAWCAVLASSANLLQAVTPQYAGDVSTYVPEDELLLVPEVYRHMKLTKSTENVAFKACMRPYAVFGS
jgi:hypothetical protein